MFETPTIADLAAAVQSGRFADMGPEPKALALDVAALSDDDVDVMLRSMLAAEPGS